MDNDLTQEQVESELAELIEKDKDKGNAKKEPKIKKPFVPKSKEEIEKLSRREQFEYKIELSRHRTHELKNEYQNYKQRESKSTKSLETKKLIIMGRFLDTQLHKRPDRKVQYMVVTGHLDQYLTDDGDRGVFCINPRKGGFWKLMRWGLG
ncbi:hypothetical protein [Chamaesiphon sp.]|uniref:hypothetical protein n=1 Tax=Chamaesiphon sp. TaxID=2814140 RepID=UPI003593D7B7